MKQLLIGAFSLVLLTHSFNGLSGNAQGQKAQAGQGQPIRLKVTPWEKGNPLSGVSIHVTKDSTVIRDFKTFKPDGWTEELAYVNLSLYTDTKYTITLSKQGYIKLVIMLDTHLPPGTVLDPLYQNIADVYMLKETEHPNLKDADFPLVLLKWDSEKRQFLPSKEYANSIRTMMQMK
ncbi:MAG: hypothetical protein ACHQRM_12335 [Bacteroidia bacterium]